MADRRRPDVAQLGPYLRAGLQLIPLHQYDHVDSRGRERGKSPRDGSWQRQEYDSRRVAEEAARDGNNVGFRIPADVLVVDVDPRRFPEGRDPLFEFDLEVGLPAGCPRVDTGSGGQHLYMRKPADCLVVDSLPDYPGIEFKSLGRQVVAAGSVHPSGGAYRWRGEPDLRRMPEAPAAMLAYVRRPSHVGGTGGGELTNEGLAALLAQLDPTDFRDHDRWLEVMMASHHATNGDGRQEFIDWSCSDPQYADQEWTIGRRWDSLHREGGRAGRAVTVATLYKRVIEAGGQIPRTPADQDFEDYEGEEGDGAAGGDGGGDGEPPRRSTLDEMNARHAVVMEDGRFRIFSEQFDPVLGRHFYTRSTKDDFENQYSNRLVEVGDGVKRLGSWWLAQPGRRQYTGVVFDPERDHEGWLNLWRGWAVEPRRGDWSLLQELVRDVLCDGDEGSYRYVMRWAAAMVQRPGSPAEVALAFRGEKGTGKGTFGRAVTSLAGAHGLHISSPTHLTGRFNSHLKDCIALFADEAFWAGDKAGESVLKQLVTEPTLTYEGKGRDAVTGRNLIHIVMASNSDWVVPAGLDGERRFAVFEVNNRAQGDKARFKAIHAQLRDGGLAAMLHDLLTMPLGDWSPRDDVPQTVALFEQKVRSMDELDNWWMERLMEGHLPRARGEWERGPITVLSAHLHEDYVVATGQRNSRALRSSQTALGTRLRRLCPAVERVKVQALDTDVGVRADAQGRCMGYVIPGLRACREAFERRLGGRFDWDGRTVDRSML